MHQFSFLFFFIFFNVIHLTLAEDDVYECPDGYDPPNTTAITKDTLCIQTVRTDGSKESSEQICKNNDIHSSFSGTRVAECKHPAIIPEGTPFEMGCPDDTYVYKEINGVEKCYKLIKSTDNRPDRCKLKDYCHHVHEHAIPATISSIEERDFIKTLVNPKTITVIGVYIPCPQPYSKNGFENVDGTDLPAHLEQMNNKEGDEFLGMITNNITQDLSVHSAKDKKHPLDVLCSITLYECKYEPC